MCANHQGRPTQNKYTFKDVRAARTKSFIDIRDTTTMDILQADFSSSIEPTRKKWFSCLRQAVDAGIAAFWANKRNRGTSATSAMWYFPCHNRSMGLGGSNPWHLPGPGTAIDPKTVHAASVLLEVLAVNVTLCAVLCPAVQWKVKARVALDQAAREEAHEAAEAEAAKVRYLRMQEKAASASAAVAAEAASPGVDVDEFGYELQPASPIVRGAEVMSETGESPGSDEAGASTLDMMQGSSIDLALPGRSHAAAAAGSSSSGSQRGADTVSQALRVVKSSTRSGKRRRAE